ncbi:hypothetical protein [Maribacter aestuarii]|uniref:hypothetical protein n=1 Tax=Maribacter aestuarii TaxID=1130723 RepID=UPI003D31A293
MNKIKIMDWIEKACEFEKRKMSHMSTSDRVSASREAKKIVLGLNEIYKANKDKNLMDWMKRVTIKKRKIDKRIKGRLEI